MDYTETGFSLYYSKNMQSMIILEIFCRFFLIYYGMKDLHINGHLHWKNTNNFEQRQSVCCQVPVVKHPGSNMQKVPNSIPGDLVAKKCIGVLLAKKLPILY